MMNYFEGHYFEVAPKDIAPLTDEERCGTVAALETLEAECGVSLSSLV
jgi:hypothetical protein